MNKPHTPGPWTIESYDDYYVVGPDSVTIAQVELADNARLIAAAPSLLEALQELADIMDDIYEGGTYRPDSFTTQPARAAINLATGQEP